MHFFTAPWIIPACAGSTLGRCSRNAASRDHPRVRGEHSRVQMQRITEPGSSPRARGALRVRVRLSRGPGIIPACAGSTAGARVHTGRCGDHPRVRGEHFLLRHTVIIRPGSSPRARGAPCCRGWRWATSGIIPACAGSTGPLRSRTGTDGDHPRVRGEHSRVQMQRITEPGSSPRARGALGEGQLGFRKRGIIPACAGSTQGVGEPAVTAGDHPRVRGEHGRPAYLFQAGLGSSPRARGAQRIGSTSGTGAGIIPACAGSTS